ncbi:MAG: hypothetical protein R2737_01550 [Candidatus Nanopelagicales bacterium]
MRTRRTAAVTALVVLGGTLLAVPAAAEEFTPFRATPNRTTAPQWSPVVITGRTAATSQIPGPVFPGPGNVLCVYRYAGGGDWRLLDICTTVRADRRFRLRAYLGITGTFTYTVGETEPDVRPGTVVDGDDMAMSDTFRITTTRR